MVFILEADKILLSRRLNTWFGENEFAPPGGNVDMNETPLLSAVRETKEEVNLQLTTESLRLIEKNVTEANGRIFENYYYATSQFTGKSINNEPHRHSDLDWYPISNLPENTMQLVIDLIPKL